MKRFGMLLFALLLIFSAVTLYGCEKDNDVLSNHSFASEINTASTTEDNYDSDGVSIPESSGQSDFAKTEEIENYNSAINDYSSQPVNSTKEDSKVNESVVNNEIASDTAATETTEDDDRVILPFVPA